MALMSSMPMATIYRRSPFVGGDYKSQDVLIATAWWCLKVQQSSVEDEILLSGGILVQDLVRYLSLEKLSKGAMVILRTLQPLCGESDNWLTLLG